MASVTSEDKSNELDSAQQTRKKFESKKNIDNHLSNKSSVSSNSLTESGKKFTDFISLPSQEAVNQDIPEVSYTANLAPSLFTQQSVARDVVENTDSDILPEIEALSSEIARLLQEINYNDNTDEAGVVVSADKDIKDASKSIWDIISSLLAEVENSEDSKQETARSQSILESLTSLLKPQQNVLISNLTPEQVSDLAKEIRLLQDESVDTDSFTFLNSILTKSLELSHRSENPKDGLNTLQAQLPVSEEQVKSNRFDLRYDLRQIIGSDTESNSKQDSTNYDFKSTLRDILSKQSPTPQASLQGSSAGSAGAAISSLSSFSSLSKNLTLGSLEADRLGSLQGAISSVQTQPSFQASLTNPTSLGYSAGQATPATHVVAASFQRLGAEKQNTNITLQLDPPELGRVEVKMSIGKDNVTKIVLIAEKPETLLLLQRDSHFLERSMHDAGLGADGSLSFELAQDGYSFGQNGNGGGGSGYSHSSGSDDQDETDVIETSVNWSVDPLSGRMRYSALI